MDEPKVGFANLIDTFSLQHGVSSGLQYYVSLDIWAYERETNNDLVNICPRRKSMRCYRTVKIVLVCLEAMFFPKFQAIISKIRPDEIRVQFAEPAGIVLNRCKSTRFYMKISKFTDVYYFALPIVRPHPMDFTGAP